MSIVLFSVGGLFALYEAFHKYEEVHAGKPNQLLESQWWWVPIAVLVAAIGMEGLSFRTAIHESQPDPRQAVLGASSSGAPRRRSCPWSCSRTSPR